MERDTVAVNIVGPHIDDLIIRSVGFVHHRDLLAASGRETAADKM
jgi:hypothetical protein